MPQSSEQTALFLKDLKQDLNINDFKEKLKTQGLSSTPLPPAYLPAMIIRKAVWRSAALLFEMQGVALKACATSFRESPRKI